MDHATSGRLHDRLQRLVVLLEDGDRRALTPLRLSPTQFNALRALADARAADTMLSVSRLAERLLCTRGNATRLVRRLEDAGWVSTTAVPGDQRSLHVRLTAEGDQLLTSARKALASSCQERFGSALSQHEQRSLLAAVEVLGDSLAEHLAHPTPRR